VALARVSQFFFSEALRERAGQAHALREKAQEGKGLGRGVGGNFFVP
jgi:hypothetical protein